MIIELVKGCACPASLYHINSPNVSSSCKSNIDKLRTDPLTL